MTTPNQSYRKMSLTKGQFALVDCEDFEWLSTWKWSSFSTKGGVFYACRGTTRNGVHKTLFMHREIMGLKAGDGLEIDHINRNPLDNRRANLRLATRKENCANRGQRRRSMLSECLRLESLLPVGSSVNFWRGQWVVKISTVCNSVEDVEALANP